MGTEMTNVNAAALAAAQALKGKLQKTKAQLPDVQGSQYLRFLQDGNWVFGQENEQVTKDDDCAINPMSIRTGWSCWTDRPGRGASNENLGEELVPLGQDAIPKASLPVHKDPKDGDKVCEWRELIAVDVKFMTGPHKGKQVLFKTTSVGGIGAMNALIDQIMLQLDEDPAHVVPIVNLDGEHYMHKKWGRTYTPVIRIVDWVSLDGAASVQERVDVDEPTDPQDDGPADEPEDDPLELKGDVVEGEVVPEPQQEEGTRRRRRR